MIVRPGQSWFRLLFIWNGSVLQSIIPQLLFMAAVSSLAVATHGRILGEKIPLNTTLLTLFGLTLAIFLAFRNNASYERFNEARHLWGNLLIASRALMSQTLRYLPSGTDRTRFIHALIACVYALKHQLRGSDPSADFRRLLGEGPAQALREKCYRPVAVLDDLRNGFAGMRERGQISDTALWMLDAQLNELGKVVGGCERIASTPIPFAYGVLLHRTIYTYCIMLPFGLVDSADIFTPLLCVFISYTLIALEAIANEVAEPFGLAPNALALDSMTRGIERSILELCGRDLPEEVAPRYPYQLT